MVSLNLSQARNDIATPPPPFSSTFTPRCEARFAINCGTSHPEGTWNLMVIYETAYTSIRIPLALNIYKVLVANEIQTILGKGNRRYYYNKKSYVCVPISNTCIKTVLKKQQ